MRLLDSRTLEFHEFIGSDAPPYAILSHTWEDGEVSFQEMSTDIERASTKPGFQKIKKCCEIALSDGFQYAWIDTCCIDKTSSAELSEAINSMYRWYEQSRVCYVYLTDVPANRDIPHEPSAFRKSRWFRRGWTLQELIAPSSVVFYGRDWNEIGTKSSLRQLIVEVTNIHSELLSGRRHLYDFSVAQRMSWASHRETTRQEDIAYCLMGIFEVNMPLLYGEGGKAFLRLQEQILNTSGDDSILAWTGSILRGSCLAASPAAFANSGNFIYTPSPPGISKSSHALTNKGLYIEAKALQTGNSSICIVLNCKDRVTQSRLGIRFQQFSPGEPYVRTTWEKLHFVTEDQLQGEQSPTVSIYLQVIPRALQFEVLERSIFSCHVETRGLRENGIAFAGSYRHLEQESGELRIITPTEELAYTTTSSSPSTMFWLTADGFSSTTLRFYCSKIDSHFDIALLHHRNGSQGPWPPTSVSIHQIPITERQKWPLHRKLESGSEDTDRATWHDSSDTVWIKVGIRPYGKSGDEVVLKIRASKTLRPSEREFERESVDRGPKDDFGLGKNIYKVAQAFKLSIDWDKPGDHKYYEPVSLVL
ncbi:uncharacterized protein PAC_09384 [Phialocephala subalpina]|uniref:Heterokaryon incompatibility domain-containing protein n=1 Tax=Phialocephala subalpina TaxID=576137 RepID=A0A1L7X397_9HELO|nr:uncharacterized protein PAC_09384 [Phialocephala subalpina]